jgi:CubicO group peptidase (beta-lactamase class C family)
MSLNHELNINDPISKYLPRNVSVLHGTGKEISLLSLSTHRSGMPRFPYNVDPKNIDEPYADYTADKLYEYISNFKPPDIDTIWRYSNVGYGLLGLILEKIAEKNYEIISNSENLQASKHEQYGNNDECSTNLKCSCRTC